MKSKRVLLTGVALIIAAAGVFAGMKKKSVTSIYFETTGNAHCVEFLAGNSSGLFVSSGTHQASTKTSGGSTVSLYSTATCGVGHPVYLNN